ncbi:MAG: hypothetical protein KDG89_10805 [Geminicoccaceae bacterium]|nr:hypothetical protein [Geminicoccaceae bacterium]
MRRLALLLALAPVLAPMLAPPSASAAGAKGTVADLVFDADLMAMIEEPGTLDYAFRMEGRTFKEPYASAARMEVREVAPDGEKQVWFDLFEGPNRRQFGPAEAKAQNPLILVFLQRDVVQMANLTGGSAAYFQHRIRAAFNGPAQVEPTTVEVDGAKVPATRVTMRPFEDDPKIDRFPAFKDKVYEFVVSDAVPGGLYRVATEVPDPKTGETILAESMTFKEIER